MDASPLLPSVNPSTTHLALPSDLLFVIFIHGFKGTDTTFGDFPQRLNHVLSESMESVVAECILFPAYETRGDLKDAVKHFAEWLTTFTVEREGAHRAGGGAGKAKIVLCGHSMGGLLAADALIELVNSRPDKKAHLWPNIIACIAFDTPYLGINPSVFANTATKAAEFVQTAQSVASSMFGGFGTKQATTPSSIAVRPSPTSGTSWGTAFAVGGALLAGAAAGTAYYKRDELTSGYSWATSHMKYVGNLLDESALRRRVDRLIDVERELGVVFRAFYMSIPPSPPECRSSRTFIVLPRLSIHATHFVLARNTIAPDEIHAHTGMFVASSNDGYYRLGLETARIIREAMMAAWGITESEERQSEWSNVAREAMVNAMKGMNIKEDKVNDGL